MHGPVKISKHGIDQGLVGSACHKRGILPVVVPAAHYKLKITHGLGQKRRVEEKENGKK
jgi:hypothetical protein